MLHVWVTESTQCWIGRVMLVHSPSSYHMGVVSEREVMDQYRLSALQFYYLDLVLFVYLFSWKLVSNFCVSNQHWKVLKLSLSLSVPVWVYFCYILFNQLVDWRKLLINLSNMGVIACDCDVRDGNGDGDSDSMVRYNVSNFLAHEPLHHVNLNEKVFGLQGIIITLCI